METTLFVKSVITFAALGLYIMTMRANARASRAEAALARVEAVIAEAVAW